MNMNFKSSREPSCSLGQPKGGQQAPVIVVGAGPVGLACAIELARLKVRIIVLEIREGVVAGSRAVGIRERSLQVLDRLGVYREVQRQGMVLRRGWTYAGDQLIGENVIQEGTAEPYPSVLLLQQDRLETILIERAGVDGNIDIRWGHTVEDLQQEGDGMRLSIRVGDATYTTWAPYVIAADGAHGGVRKKLGIDYQGGRFDQHWIIADFKIEADIEKGRRLWFDPPYCAGSTTILYQLPGDEWRLDYLIPLDGNPSEEERPDKVCERIDAHLKMMGIAADWSYVRSSTYAPT
ncbi:MAG: FAD-dependent monooxygenase, partial [Pigmentiphaga sp.]